MVIETKKTMDATTPCGCPCKALLTKKFRLRKLRSIIKFPKIEYFGVKIL